MTNFKSNMVVVLLSVLGISLVKCAGTPDVNPTVQKARRAFDEIKDDSLVISHAPEQMEEAKKAVNEVVTAIANNENQDAVERKLQLAEQRIRIAQKVAEVRAARQEVEHSTAELQRLMDQLEQIEREAVASGQIKVPIEERVQQLTHFQAFKTDRGLVIRFLDLRFAQEEASLTSRVEPPINELADFLSTYPKRNVLIEGHTDNTGAASFNKTLSQQRADVVRDALISRGVNPDRIQSVGLGEQYPIASNDTELGRRENRRVEVVISDESGKIPKRQE